MTSPYRRVSTLPAADGVLGEGNLYALALTPTALYVTCNGDDTKGWVAKADLNGTKFGKSESGSIMQQVLAQHLVHVPKRVLGSSRFRGMPGMRMNVRQGKMAKDKA